MRFQRRRLRAPRTPRPDQACTATGRTTAAQACRQMRIREEVPSKSADRERGGGRQSGPPQHPSSPPDVCRGGHGTEPKEQYTQQSPLFGRSKAWQLVHS